MIPAGQPSRVGLTMHEIEMTWQNRAMLQFRKYAEDNFTRMKMVNGWKEILLSAFKNEIHKLIVEGEFAADPREFLRRTLLGFQVSELHNDIHILGDTPRFKHDCDRCEFYGCVDFQDLWYCPTAKPLPTMIIRRSADPPDYISGARSYGIPELEFAWGIKDTLTKVTW